MIRSLIYAPTWFYPLDNALLIEVIHREQAQGNEVWVVMCPATAHSCPYNPHKLEQRCIQCQQNQFGMSPTLKELGVRLIQRKTEKEHFERAENIIDDLTNWEELRSYKFDHENLGQYVFADIVYIEKNYEPCWDKNKELTVTLLAEALALYQFTKDIIAEFNISRLFVWNGRRASDGPAYLAGRKNCIESFTYIEGVGAHDTILITPTPYVHDFQHRKELLESNIPSESESKQALKFFEASEGKGDIPHYRTFASDFEIPDSQTNHDPYVVLFPSSMWETYGLPDYQHEFLGNQYEMMPEVIQSMLNEGLAVIVRWHPNLRHAHENEHRLIKEIDDAFASHSGYTAYPPESNVNSYSLLKNSRFTITFGSTIGIESLYHLKPSLLLGKAWYEDLPQVWKPSQQIPLIDLAKWTLEQPFDPEEARKSSLQFAWHRINTGEKWNHIKHSKLGYSTSSGTIINVNHRTKLIPRISFFIARLRQKLFVN